MDVALERRRLRYLTARGWQRLGWAVVILAAVALFSTLLERWQWPCIAYAAVPAAEPLPSVAVPSAVAEASADVARPTVPSPDDWRRFFDAIATVESGMNDRAVGDGGRARGRYQITEAYWIDGGGAPAAWATGAHLSQAAEQVIVNYLYRYAPRAFAAGDWPTLARIHHGGPRGTSSSATAEYAERVVNRLEAFDAR